MSSLAYDEEGETSLGPVLLRLSEDPQEMVPSGPALVPVTFDFAFGDALQAPIEAFTR